LTGDRPGSVVITEPTMSWWQFWRKDTTAPTQAAEPAADRRLAALQRRRADALFDVEQAELAEAAENPWSERIALLTEALATIETDRRALDALPPTPSYPLPPTPIEQVVAYDDTGVVVRFSIDREAFEYREETDWNERGGPTVRGDLRRQAGDPAALVPSDVPADLRDALIAHLDGSLDVFAVDVRDRTLAGEPPPEGATLADLAQPCPDCGGWRDWHGRCAECARRELRRRELRGEAERIERERAAEADERHRLIERLPIARRRLAAIDGEIAALGR
jgi:hypothetical protein